VLILRAADTQTMPTSTARSEAPLPTANGQAESVVSPQSASLDVERTVSQSPTPIPGGSVSPADATASPRRRPAGGALDAESAHRVNNKNGRDGWTRRGHAQEVAAPMPHQPSAQDALDRSFLGSGIQRVEAACQCGDDLDGALILIREVEDGEIVDTLVADRGYGDGPTVLDCDACGRALAPDIAVLRDRRRRCELALAAEIGATV